MYPCSRWSDCWTGRVVLCMTEWMIANVGMRGGGWGGGREGLAVMKKQQLAFLQYMCNLVRLGYLPHRLSVPQPHPVPLQSTAVSLIRWVMFDDLIYFFIYLFVNVGQMCAYTCLVHERWGCYANKYIYIYMSMLNICKDRGMWQCLHQCQSLSLQTLKERCNIWFLNPLWRS